MVGSQGRQARVSRTSAAASFASLARAGRFRDEETAAHVERMSLTCAMVARELGWDFGETQRLRIASSMHDIGKLSLPDAVLLKPGALSPAERAMVERHAEIGHRMLAGSNDALMQLAATIALTHHERVDGSGYPRCLRGDQIPLAGRIAAVADVFDALTHDRVYRRALSVEDAVAVLREGRGTQFDARVLDAFEAVLSNVVAMRSRYPDESAGAQTA